MEGDEDEEDVDDIEYEFKMEEEKYKLKHEENMNSRDHDGENPKSIGKVSLFLIYKETKFYLEALISCIELIFINGFENFNFSLVESFL